MATPFDFAPGTGDEFDTPFGTDPVTDRQRSYLHSLLMRKGAVAYALKITDEYDQIVYSKVAHKIIDSLDKWSASSRIDKLKTELAGLEERLNEAKMRGEVLTVPNEFDDGFYELPDGTICKVQHAVNGSGNQYAKRLDPDTGTFNYVSGLITAVKRDGARLTLDRARHLGQLYGICIRCGRTLTDENSIANGIGPICANLGF